MTMPRTDLQEVLCVCLMRIYVRILERNLNPLHF